MTEISDGASILSRHINELYAVGAIDSDRKTELHEQLDLLVDEIQGEYEEM